MSAARGSGGLRDVEMPIYRRSWLGRRLRRLSLWPRLVIGVTLGFLVLFGIFSVLSLQAINDSTNRILMERLVIAQLAAQEIDRLLARAFYELEKAPDFATFAPEVPSQAEEVHMLAHAYGRLGAFALGVYYLDAGGRVVLAEPAGKLLTGTDLSAEEHIKGVRETGRRVVSDPFIDTYSGKPAVALTIPIFRRDGTLMSVLSGLIDVGSPEFTAPLMYARDVGHTGHAELVDHLGRIVVATDYGGFLRPGEHLPFYLKIFQRGGAAVENVPYVPWHPLPEGRQKERHIMAFAPLTVAPWGVAVGGNDWETLAPVVRLRNAILVGGAVSLVILWVLTLVAARLLVRPVRALTVAAQQMASGALDPSIQVGEGGEIGLLAESLEAMRVQLKESMDRMRRWGEELEAKVEERTQELGQLQAQRALDQMKAEFISAVSHELRTPLGIIKGYATALSIEDAAIDPATRLEFLQVIEEGADRLQRMIDELLDASRLQAGRLQVEPRVILVKELLESAVHKALPLLQGSGHTVEAPVFPEGVAVKADPVRVEQVLNNLLDNAARYSSPGTAIEIRVTLQEEQVSISVTDHGHGIPPQDLEHIFEPFYRGTNALRAGIRGTGLGLAICRGIVAAHGGRLWVESTLTKGSTFVFTLPRAEGHIEPS